MCDQDSQNNQPKFNFLKGSEDMLAPQNGNNFDWEKSAEKARQHISDAMNASNIVFLLGSGCSSLIVNGEQIGIPTMKPMAKRFVTRIEEENHAYFLTKKEHEFLCNTIGIDITHRNYADNLERLLELLINLNFSLQRIPKGKKNGRSL